MNLIRGHISTNVSISRKEQSSLKCAKVSGLLSTTKPTSMSRARTKACRALTSSFFFFLIENTGLADSSIELSQLQVSQRRKHNRSPRDPHPDSEISAVSSYHLSDGTHVPDLVHGDDRTSPSDEKRGERG
jgi:hypothetical protein